MERRFITSLKEGDTVDAVFALRAKEMRAARTGEAYLAVELCDRTGTIGAIMFRPGREAAVLPVGGAVHVRGTVTSFRGVLRVAIDRVRPAKDFDPGELMPSGTRDPKELLAELRRVVASVKTAPLKAVLLKVFGDAELMREFKLCPASQDRHHAYLGGLLEHTVGVAALCRQLADTYPHADRDLLVSAALLHDIGKVDELDYGTGIGYTDDGRLIGHVMLGERRVRAAIEALGEAVPQEVARSLSHVMLSHHGELEWGSPKRPSTLEALMLHHADNLDAKISGFIAATVSAGLLEEPWTDAGNLFRRPLWAPRAVEDDRPRAYSDDDQYARTA